MIFRSMTELIGATPLVELCRYREYHLRCQFRPFP